MIKSVNIKLNKFTTIPNSIREFGKINLPMEQIEVNLANLFHHYYLDKYGRYIPNPNPADFEYFEFLSNTTDFRIQGDGLGASTTARRNSSTDLGQAFCRQFLYEHLNITYFAHMEHVIDKKTIPAFNGMKIERSKKGDVPDYLCAENVDKVFIAEAKGRYSAINFTSREFQSWRNQFDRIVAKNNRGTPIRIKGYIVGTRLVTEANKKSMNTTIYAEDPETIGERDISDNDGTYLGERIISLHYSNIAEKINQPILASCLYHGFTVPNEIQFPSVVWELAFGPLKGMKFIGGYYGKEINYDSYGKIITNSLDLMASRVTFFGVEENVYINMIEIARYGMANAREMPVLKEIEPFYSGVSILRDGSIIAPIEFLKPLKTQIY